MMNVEERRLKPVEEQILSRKGGEKMLSLNDQNLDHLRDVLMESMLSAQSTVEVVRLLNAAKGFTDALEGALEGGSASKIELVEKVLKAAASLLRQQKGE